MRARRGYVALVLAASALWASPGQAQRAPTPGAVREPLAPATTPALPADAPAPDAQAPAPRVPVPEGGPAITVDRFELSGNTIFDAQTLLEVIAPYRGRALTLYEIYAAADQIAGYYRERGYTVANVVVPAQKISDGVVRLEVVEGRIGKIAFEGNSSYSDAFLTGQLDELISGEAVKSDRLQRELLLLNDMPGLEARAVIKPGEQYGTSDVLIKATEDRFAGAVTVDNYGRESIGEWRASLDLAFNNPTGAGDRLLVSAQHAQGGLLDYGSITYGRPIGNSGTRVRALFARFVYDVDTDALRPRGAFTGFELDGSGEDYRVEVVHPLVRGRRHNLLLGAGLSRTESAEGGTLVPVPGNDHITLVDVSAVANWVHDESSASAVSAVFSTNFRSNPDGRRDNAQLGKLRVEASHLRPLQGPWTLLLRANGVLSLDPLDDLQRYRIGGVGSVRAFPSSELAGDQGFMLTVQAQRGFRLFDSVRGRFRVFWDGGVVHRKTGARKVSGERASRSLTGVGAGVSLDLPYDTSFDLEAVRPTNNWEPSDGRDGGRVWARLSKGF